MSSLLVLTMLAAGQVSAPARPPVIDAFLKAVPLVGQKNTEVVAKMGSPASANGDSFVYRYAARSKTDSLTIRFDKQNQVERILIDLKSAEPTMSQMAGWLKVKPGWVVVYRPDAQLRSMDVSNGKPSKQNTRFWIHGMMENGVLASFGPFWSAGSAVVGDKRLNLQTNRYEVVDYRVARSVDLLQSKPMYGQMGGYTPVQQSEVSKQYFVMEL